MKETSQATCEVIARVRSQRPLIHHITNFVVMNATANITLCMGALPVMAHAPQEVEEMVGAASALVLNLGTLWPEQVEAMLLAGRRANQRGIPIVLDPVGAGATRLRTESAHRLLKELSIAIVRGNLAEIATLAGMEAKIRGVESMGSTGDAALIASQFAKKFGCVAAVTGPIDVCDGWSAIDAGDEWASDDGNGHWHWMHGDFCCGCVCRGRKRCRHCDRCRPGRLRVGGRVRCSKSARSGDISGASVRCCCHADARGTSCWNSHRGVTP